MKKILYIDMDGVIANFCGEINKYAPDFDMSEHLPYTPERVSFVDNICESNPRIFSNLDPIEGGIAHVKKLFTYYEIYFLSTPMWNVPESFTDKRIWIDKHFGVEAEKRLILTHRKDLALGDFLVDDRLKNGADKFVGEHIHFGTEKFPDWPTVYNHLVTKYFQSIEL